MSERGESVDPVRMLNVASWRKLRPSRGRVQRGLESQNLRPPNPRLQRTRSAPLRSPPAEPQAVRPRGQGAVAWFAGAEWSAWPVELVTRERRGK